jgi:hypothetical protein
MPFQNLWRVIAGSWPTTAADSDVLTVKLRDAGVPFAPLSEACEACEAPCDMGEYPPMRLDTSSDMLGRLKPYAKQVRPNSFVVSVALGLQWSDLTPICSH